MLTVLDLEVKITLENIEDRTNFVLCEKRGMVTIDHFLGCAYNLDFLSHHITNIKLSLDALLQVMSCSSPEDGM